MTNRKERNSNDIGKRSGYRDPYFQQLAHGARRARGSVRARERRYTVVFDSAKSMLGRIKAGETGDVVILGASVVKELQKHGIVAAGSVRPFARSRVGVAVRAGAPRPDISSVEAFKRALLD